MKQPWMKFHPTDWRGEPRLRMCSLAARGLWIDLMSYMHEGSPYGHLTIEGVSPDLHAVVSLVGRPIGEVRKAMAELEQRQVFSRTDGGVIFSRRMVRDKEKSEQGRESIERRWGAPKREPNRLPTDQPNTKKPDTRGQKEESKSRASRAKARTPIPENWTVDAIDADHASGRGFTPGQIALMGPAFADHHRSRGNLMADWRAAWRTWCANEIKFQRNNNGGQRGNDRQERSVGRGAVRNAEEGFAFGPKPSLVPTGGSEGTLRLLPQRRGE